MSTEQRVYAHYKSLKRMCTREFVTDRIEMSTYPGSDVEFPRRYGHYELRFPNSGWLLLARVHKMPVRRVKDIITHERLRRKTNANV